MEPWQHHKAVPVPVIACLGLCLAGCATASTVREDRQLADESLAADADDLYRALEEVALARGIPLARRDAQTRRLTSEWIAEAGDLRRCYYLSVIHQPGLLALRVRIVRQRLTVEDGVELWQDVDRDPAVIEEENAILSEAYQRWQNGPIDDDS